MTNTYYRGSLGLLILFGLCALSNVVDAANYNSTIIAFFSETSQSHLIQQSVVIESIDHKLNLVVANRQKQIVNSTVRIFFVHDDLFKCPETTSIQLKIPLSDWHVNDDICWVPLDAYCNENQESKLRSHAIHPPATGAIFPDECLVELISERNNGLRAPLDIRCPVSATGDNSDSGTLRLKWTSECLGAPVFFLTPDGAKGDFLGIVSSKAERGFQFVTASKILQLLGAKPDEVTPIPTPINNRTESSLARARARISAGFTLVLLPPNILAVCSTTALASKRSVGSDNVDKKSQAALLNALVLGEESDWTHSEYALSHRTLLPDDYSQQDWQTLLSLSYDFPQPTSEFMKAGCVEHLNVNSVRISDCLMNHSPRALSRLGTVTSEFEEIEPGQPLFELGDDQTLKVSGFVVDTFRNPFTLGFKDILCGGRYMPFEDLLTFLPTVITEHYGSTSTKELIPNISHSYIKLKFQGNFVNGCIVRTDDAYYLVTVGHALEGYLDEDIGVFIPLQTKSDLLYVQHTGFVLPHAQYKWKTSDSDVAIVRFTLDQVSKENAAAIDQAALVIDEEHATHLQPAQDAYIVTNWVYQEFVYRNWIVTPCLGGDSTYNPMMFGILPGLMKGSSGSPVIQLNQGKPNLIGLIREGIVAGDDVLMNFCVSSSEINKLIKSSTQFALPPP